MTDYGILFLFLSILMFITALILGLLFFTSKKSLQSAVDENKNLNRNLSDLTVRYQSISDVDAEKKRITQEIEDLYRKQKELTDKFTADYKNKVDEAESIKVKVEQLQKEFAELDEIANMQSFGFYTPRYGFESSSRYQIKLDQIRSLQKAMISNKTAAICDVQWTVNGSIVEGRKQINQTLKLILRAFNGECDAAIAKVKYNNVNVMEKRILRTYEALNKLVTIQSIYLNSKYLKIKLEELYLVHEYQEKIQEEKEEQRRIREEMREEEVARREIERALADAEREESRYAEALRKARDEVETAVGVKQAKLLAQIELLQEKLAEAQTNRERAISRAQMTRSGHVYVISNIGSFGDNIYKIGMTRRLDPMDRVRELGDASVPFRFDVHAIIFSEDAPTLEHKLHLKFHNRRVNQVNHRREFFKVTLNEISQAVHEFHGEIEFTLLAEADEYRKTLAFLNKII